MALYTTVDSQLKPFSASVSDSSTMSDFPVQNSADKVQACQARSLFANLPAACLALVVYVDVPKDFDYSSASRSFGCSVCAHGFYLDGQGLCQAISDCDASYANANFFFNGCAKCAAGFSLTYFNNNGNGLTVSFEDNDSGNSDLHNQTTLANRYANQWIFNHHDLSASPPRDMYNDALSRHISEVDYTSCHDTSAEPRDQTHCFLYDFVNRKCDMCEGGFQLDSFGLCQDQALPVGCSGWKDPLLEPTLAQDPGWSAVALDSTSSDFSRMLANDLQALSFYSNLGQSCQSCDFGWRQILNFSENVGALTEKAMCTSEKSGKYISNCEHYPSWTSELLEEANLTCQKCRDNFVLASDLKSCVDVKTRIQNGETWLVFCRVLAADGTSCSECASEELVELHLGRPFWTPPAFFRLIERKVQCEEQRDSSGKRR